MNIPYVGCGVLAGACGMDKVIMKDIFKANNIPVVDYTYFYRSELKDLQSVLKNVKN